MATITRTPSNTWKVIIRRKGWPTTARFEAEEAEQEAIVALVPEAVRDDARKQLAFQRRSVERLESPAAKREAFAVPQLCLAIQGELELAELELFLDLGGWNLLDYAAQLNQDEFKAVEGYRVFPRCR